MLTSDRVRQGFVLLFVFGFFAYLFGPLIIMAVSAFNSSAFPRVAPWECFTVEWFSVLANDGRLLTGVRNSLFIGLGVVCLAVPLGLAAALMLMQVGDRMRPWYYTIVISPILVPGVVLGISTLLFWDRVAHMFGATRTSIFYDGFFLTIIGQATFISAYTMLIFISRLQRFDSVQEEAALDLGATHVQTFRKILLPFLKPAIASATVLAFLASFENYNTTVFTAISTSTLTTVLASKVRYGIDPSISALAVTIIALTLIGAAVHEVLKRRELARDKEAEQVAQGLKKVASKQRSWFLDPALILISLIVISGVGTTLFAGTIGVEECKAGIKAEKKRVTQERIEALRARNRERDAQRAAEQPQDSGSQPATDSVKPDRGGRKGTENFNSIFSNDNLTPEQKQQEAVPDNSSTPKDRSGRKGTENFNSIFSNDNLVPEKEGDAGSEAGEAEPEEKAE